MVSQPHRDVEAHVRRLWRRRGTVPPGPRRGPRPQLDLEEILDAAIAIADADGLDAVSTRAVAARFDKTAMALYPYVGTKEHLLALMRDHASAMPAWEDPAGLADALRAWALALFEVYVAHPWLAERPWAEASQGPNEHDWLERLVGILEAGGVPPTSRPVAVTMVYATVRACAETSAAYRRIGPRGVAEWRAHADAVGRLIPDLCERYPRSTSLVPLTPDWRENPRAAVIGAVDVLAVALVGA
jgi:AcrR family transcriptional regulator